jgi:anti-sigma factor RsiW
MNAELSHESVSQLMPWYANSTLSPEEHAAVEEHLKSCAACRSELDWLQNVSAAMTDLAEEAPAASPSFAKVLASVDEWERSKGSLEFEPSRQRSWMAGWFDVVWNPPASVARFALAASFALVIGLGIYLAVPRGASPAYTTLSGSEPAADGAKLTVSFAPNTTVEQMGQVLLGIRGTIVSGPSANGIYVVALPINSENNADIQVVIEKLRNDKAIRFVGRQP